MITHGEGYDGGRRFQHQTAEGGVEAAGGSGVGRGGGGS